MKKTFSLVLLFFTFIGNGISQNGEIFKKATEAYNNGEYQKAIDLYDGILGKEQHSPELYFNLGNCYYKLDEIGPSIYYYEKALLLKPNDPEILNNLGFAQNMRLDAIAEMPKTAMTRLHDTVVNALSFDQWAYLAVALIILFVLAYILYYLSYSSTKKRVAFLSSITSLGLSLFSLVMAYMAYQDFNSDNPAIIFNREVVVTSEPNQRSEKVFALHEGTKVNVLESLETWSKIKIDDGQTGWIPSENIRLLKDF